MLPADNQLRRKRATGDHGSLVLVGSQGAGPGHAQVTLLHLFSLQPALLCQTPARDLDKFIADLLQPNRQFLDQVNKAVDTICSFLRENCFRDSPIKVLKVVKVSARGCGPGCRPVVSCGPGPGRTHFCGLCSSQHRARHRRECGTRSQTDGRGWAHRGPRGFSGLLTAASSREATKQVLADVNGRPWKRLPSGTAGSRSPCRLLRTRLFFLALGPACCCLGGACPWDGPWHLFVKGEFPFL